MTTQAQQTATRSYAQRQAVSGKVQIKAWVTTKFRDDLKAEAVRSSQTLGDLLEKRREVAESDEGWQAIVDKRNREIAQLRRNQLVGDAALKAEVRRLREELGQVRVAAYMAGRRDVKVGTHMTPEEIKLVRGCLHPDRLPEHLRDNASRAFQIFNRVHGRR